MEHGKKAAVGFAKLIRQTAPKDGKPGKNRSLIVGNTEAQPVILVSPKRPTSALAELKAMSKKLGAVSPLAISQVVFEEGVVHVKVFKPANEMSIRKAFAAYFKKYGVAPPSAKVRLWQPDEWDAKEFEEDPDDAAEEGDTDADDQGEEAAEDEDDAADEPDEEPEDGEAAEARAAKSKAQLAALGGFLKNAARQVASLPEIRPLVVTASGQLKAAGELLAGGRQDEAEQALDAAKGTLAQIAARVRAAPAQGPRPLDIWRAAKDEIDQGIGALQQAMLRYPAPSLQAGLKELADKGLNGVTDRASVGMMAAMTEAESSPATRAKAVKAVETFRAFLATPMARLIDDNPFGVTVGLRSKLGAALDTIAGRLNA